VNKYSYLQTSYCFTKYTFSISSKVIWCNEFFQNPLNLENCKICNLLPVLNAVSHAGELSPKLKCRLYTLLFLDDHSSVMNTSIYCIRFQAFMAVKIHIIFQIVTV